MHKHFSVAFVNLAINHPNVFVDDENESQRTW